MKATLGVLPWEMDSRWLLTVPLRKEFWKKDRERRKIGYSDNKLINAVYIAQRGSPAKPASGALQLLRIRVKKKRGVQC